MVEASGTRQASSIVATLSLGSPPCERQSFLNCMVNARETWLLAFLLTGLGACSKETPAPVLTRPVAGQLVDVALQDLVASSLLDAEANPNDAAKRATLGLVYEANQV